jgi:hypothetical protein
MDANITTDTVELDELETLTETETSGNLNMPIVGAALIGGALIGKFVVPPVTNFVKGLFSKSPNAEVLEIAASVETPETPEVEAV